MYKSFQGATVAHLSLMPMKSMLKEDLFDEETMDFLVIVNQHLSSSQRFRLRLNPYYKVYEVKAAKVVSANDRTKNAIEENLIDSSDEYIERTIAPGDALILRWK